MPDSAGRYRLTPLALADLEHIWRYSLRTWSAEQADTYHQDIVDALEGLAAGRKVGRKADIREGYFKYAVGSHVLYYRHDTGGLLIVRILHRRMDAQRHL